MTAAEQTTAVRDTTAQMLRLEQEIARQNRVLRQFELKDGNLSNVPKEIMNEYNNNLALWDSLKIKRQALKNGEIQ